MAFERHNQAENLGQKVGFLLGYLIFTSILFIILTYFNKMPSSWTYGHVALLTAGIVLTGKLLGRWLK